MGSHGGFSHVNRVCVQCPLDICSICHDGFVFQLDIQDGKDVDKGSVVCCVSGIVHRVCGGVQKIHKQWFLCHDK